MTRISTSGSPWAIVFLGAVIPRVSACCLSPPRTPLASMSRPSPHGDAGGPGIAAFGAGAVRRMDGRFGGRGWSVLGFVILTITSVAVGIRAGDGVASAAGLLGLGVAGLRVVAAGVTISRGVLARRMSVTGGAPVVDSARERSVATRPGAPGRRWGCRSTCSTPTPERSTRRTSRSAAPPSGRWGAAVHLWVFDEWTNDGLIDLWRTVGPVQLLRGGGALGGVGTLLATITGRVGDLIEETDEEVPPTGRVRLRA